MTIENGKRVNVEVDGLILPGATNEISGLLLLAVQGAGKILKGDGLKIDGLAYTVTKERFTAMDMTQMFVVEKLDS